MEKIAGNCSETRWVITPCKNSVMRCHIGALMNVNEASYDGTPLEGSNFWRSVENFGWRHFFLLQATSLSARDARVRFAQETREHVGERCSNGWESHALTYVEICLRPFCNRWGWGAAGMHLLSLIETNYRRRIGQQVCSYRRSLHF